TPLMYCHGTQKAELKLPKSDYRAYRVRALSVLRETQIRAAMAEGGILWRLTIELLTADEGLFSRAIDLCTSGPVLDKGKQTLVQIFPPDNGTLYVDNGLTDSEADVLCGMYLRYSRGSKILMVEQLSWWPKPSLFVSSGFNTGIWNPWNKDWFQRHLQSIRDGNAMPKNADKWRSGLRLTTDTGRLADLVEKAS
ncbi:hypothetical protein C8T65DRAFT_543504, partial [Cerioporus squamosus]